MARDVLRLGVIQSVDLAAARCVVAFDDELITGPIPFAALRAGDLSIWAPPSEGEQVLVYAPEGDLERAIAGPGVFCAAKPPPADHAGVHIRFDEANWIGYDAGTLEIHVEQLVRVNAGRVEIVATERVEITGDTRITGKVTIDGDVDVDGAVSATDDVSADGVSLKDHTHSGVTAGGATSGKPVK